MTVHTWSATAASNSTADATVNWQEGQAPSTVNNSARAMMAAVAKWREDLSGNLVTAGTAVAYTATATQGFTGLVDGLSITLRMHAANTINPTLNVSATGARAIASVFGGGLAAGALPAGSIQRFTYDETDNKWLVHSQNELAALARTAGNFVVGTGTSFGVESGATARNSLGLGASSNPQFATIELGAATDTTLSRASAGNLAIEGNLVYRVGGQDVAVTDGGSGASTASGARTAFDVPQMPSGTSSLFVQTAAPTGWTKDTTHNNKALRVVTGTASSGGSLTFTTAFQARTISVSNLPSHSHSISASGTTSSNGDHRHFVASDETTISGGGSDLNTTQAMRKANAAGAGDQDSYALKRGSIEPTFSRTSLTGAHTHTVTVSGTSGAAGSGTPIDFSVAYVDVIIASLN